MRRSTCRSSRGLCTLCLAVFVYVCAQLASLLAFTALASRLPRAPGSVAGRRRRHLAPKPLPGAAAYRRVALHAGAEDDVAAADEDAPGRSRLVQAWGTLGVCSYLGYGVAKVVPIVLDGLGAIEAGWQWALLAVTLLFFAYVEGYRGFQKGFSPRVVSRAWVVSEETASAPFWHKILAPAFCIGYFHGTTKRVATSWGVTSVIFAVVIGVKQLANPYRAIIDAGVIVGLVWGIVSILLLFAASLRDDEPPDFDPALPEETPYTAPAP
mmetsp:Transcript_51816/g.160719  ORF Transcript_51816/g.160719 Transcript_51816/m.160719 type:complete len:268 (-) Transcript_51816:58-861(-)